MADQVSSAVEVRLLQVLQNLELSISSQSKQFDRLRDSSVDISAAFDRMARQITTTTFLMERMVGSLNSVVRAFADLEYRSARLNAQSSGGGSSSSRASTVYPPGSPVAPNTLSGPLPSSFSRDPQFRGGDSSLNRALAKNLAVDSVRNGAKGGALDSDVLTRINAAIDRAAEVSGGVGNTGKWANLVGSSHGSWTTPERNLRMRGAGAPNTGLGTSSAFDRWFNPQGHSGPFLHSATGNDLFKQTGGAGLSNFIGVPLAKVAGKSSGSSAGVGSAIGKLGSVAMVAGAALQAFTDLLGTGISVVAQVLSTAVSLADHALKAGAPDAAATLHKSFQWLAAVLGEQLVPYALKFAGQIQTLIHRWEALDPAAKKAATELFMVASGLDALLSSVMMLSVAFDALADILPGGGKQERWDTQEGQDVLNKRGTNAIAGVRAFNGIDLLATGGAMNAISGSKVGRALNPIGSYISDRANKFSDEVDANKTKLGFADRAQPQFIALDQVWRSMQLNLLKGDDIDREILKVQNRAHETLIAIETNTARNAGGKAAVK